MGTSAPENGIYGISGLWDLGIMGFVICGILVLWEKEGEEGRNRERRVGQEPWSISPFQVRACENRRSGLTPFSGRDNCRERDREGEVQECVEHTLRKDQKITKNTKNICLKDKKEKKQINNAGFW